MSNKMWGGRFTERPDAIMEEINVSIDVDRHLYAQDIAASKAHAAMLAAQGIITADDAKNIARGLDTILSEIGKGSFDFKRALEDIHMNVESRLGELIGPAAGRLHTARSRNDQVATDFRLYVRDTIDETDAALASFQHALVDRALEHARTVLRRWPAHRSRSIAMPPQRRSISTGRWPIRSTRFRTATSCSRRCRQRRSRRCICRVLPRKS